MITSPTGVEERTYFLALHRARRHLGAERLGAVLRFCVNKSCRVFSKVGSKIPKIRITPGLSNVSGFSLESIETECYFHTPLLALSTYKKFSVDVKNGNEKRLACLISPLCCCSCASRTPRVRISACSKQQQNVAAAARTMLPSP